MITKYKKWICGVIVFCFLVLLFSLSNKNSDSNTANTMTEIVLLPNKSEYDMDHDQEILKKRAEFTFQEYSLEKEESYFRLRFNKEEVDRKQLIEYMEFFLCETMDMYLADTSIHTLLNYGYVSALEKDDILEYSLQDVSEEKENYRKLYFQFNNRIEQLIQDFHIENIGIFRDYLGESYTTNSYSGVGIGINKDENGYYTKYSDSSLLYGKEESFMYSLTHDSLSTSYNYYIQDEIEWQNIENLNSNEIGTNQVDTLDGEDLYTITYTNRGNRYAADELEKVNENFKIHLDSLDTPYMYGLNSYGDISIKLSSKRVNDLTLSTIKNEASFYIQCGTNHFSVSSNILEIGEDNQSIDLFLSKENMTNLQTAISKNKDNRVYLILNNTPIMYLDYKEQGNNSKLHFDHFCYKEDEKGEAWLLNHVNTLYNNTDNSFTTSYKLTNIVYNEDGIGDRSHYGLKNSYLNDFTEMKKELMDEYDFIKINNTSSVLLINFTKEMNPKETVQNMERIYKSIQEKSPYMKDVRFNLSNYERILFSLHSNHINQSFLLIDLNKKDFNKEFYEEMKENDFFYTMMKEEYESSYTESSFDEYFANDFIIVTE